MLLSKLQSRENSGQVGRRSAREGREVGPGLPHGVEAAVLQETTEFVRIVDPLDYLGQNLGRGWVHSLETDDGEPTSSVIADLGTRPRAED